MLIVVYICCHTVCSVRYCVMFFFFKQKSAYEMLISDWSSDVCSSDLRPGNAVRYRGVPAGTVAAMRINPQNLEQVQVTIAVPAGTPIRADTIASLELERSEERRVGKEWVSTGRNRWLPDK